MTKKMNKKGFTLAELLVVVAIIAVLVAISIPVFTAQLEKAKEATDLANIRAAYAELMVSALEAPESTTLTKSVTLKQAKDGWTTADAGATLTQIVGNASYVVNTPKATKAATVAWVPASGTVDGHITITFGQ